MIEKMTFLRIKANKQVFHVAHECEMLVGNNSLVCEVPNVVMSRIWLFQARELCKMNRFKAGAKSCEHSSLLDLDDWMLYYLRSYCKASGNEDVLTEGGTPARRNEQENRDNLNDAFLQIGTAEMMLKDQWNEHRESKSSISNEMILDDIQRLKNWIGEAITILGGNPDSMLTYNQPLRTLLLPIKGLKRRCSDQKLPEVREIVSLTQICAFDTSDEDIKKILDEDERDETIEAKTVSCIFR